MLVFVIPLKSREVSKSWQYVCKLLERCVRSVCNQTSPAFKVIVVCHEKPEIEFNHSSLIYLEVDFPMPKAKNPVNRGDTDKGRKLLAGSSYGQQFNASHAMFVDADDCISKHLAEFVSQSPQSNGWFIDRGYKYQEGSQYIYVKHRNFYRMCGTSNIIRYDLLDLPKVPEYNRGYNYYRFYIEHRKIREFMNGKGNLINRLPFAGGIYILGTENIFGNDSKLSFNFLNRQKITPALRDEFSLYSIDSNA